MASSCGIHVSASAFWSPFRAQLDAAMPNLDSVNFPGPLNYLGVTILIYFNINFNVSRAITTIPLYHFYGWDFKHSSIKINGFV